MFDFVIKDNPEREVSLDYIETIESDNNCTFPAILKDYYSKHNGATINECRFKKYGLEFCVVRFVMLKHGTLPFEAMRIIDRKNEALPNSLLPLAVDEDQDYYYWDTNTGKVYYITFSNIERLLLISESVEEFFEILNEC